MLLYCWASRVQQWRSCYTWIPFWAQRKEWMFAEMLWEALSPPCAVSTAGHSRAWALVLCGATSTLESLQESCPPGCHICAQMFHIQALPSLHLPLESHHGLHSLAGKKHSYVTANFINNIANGWFKLTQFFLFFLILLVHNSSFLKVYLNMPLIFHLLNLHCFLFVTWKLVAMEMIAEDLLNRGLKKDCMYQQMGLAVSKEEISPKI